MSTSNTSNPSKTHSQVDKFRQLAREIGADEDEAAFKAKLVKVARARAPLKSKD